MVLGFIGLGNMAKALMGGIISKGIFDPQDIIGSDPMEAARDSAARKFGIQTKDNNADVAREADVILLAVKPQFLKVAIADIMDEIDENKLIISIAAGKSLEWIAKEFEKPVKTIRVMPNTPALVGEGCAAVCPNNLCSDSDLNLALDLLRSCGTANVVTENLMDVVTGVSGSSPAYVFLFIEAMADAAVLGGMPRKQAYEFAAQAVLGSAKMVLETGKHPGELKDMVCSPAGTTIEAVKVMEEMGFRGIVMNAVQAATERSKEL
ncbi:MULTISPECIES: pyrroline-5-carboxylate reductase [unclassified Butyrivibrio]|uniref:pyrroline-5-carboxylate reductase n=1 Tax=unclassified Butyrivibrio TaxID=2639466 RepID=UPI0003B7B0F1|nr:MULTISPECIES: pyrroline-5-carboxylate reductase [unclassified Butyrivibrio]SEK95044.1 pyrroline-5-carboxylate reductase [Butyrivibrio sp. ob235]